MNRRPMVSGTNRLDPGKRRERFIPFPVPIRRASPRLAAAARGRQTVPAGVPQRVTLKRSSSIIEVVFKNVFLRGAIKSVERQREGGATPTDLGPGAPNKLWEVIVEGAEYEAKGYFKPKEAVNGQDVVVLINNTFGHYNVHLEAKTILEWNFKRIWGFSHKDWYKASKVQKAFTITDVSYKDLIEIGTLAFGTVEQKRAMGFK